MSFRRICNRTLSKNISRPKLTKKIRNKKIALQELPFTTIKVTLRMLKGIFFLIFIYIGVSIFILFLQGGDEQIRNIIVYSISGFFTFFMGYFGWMFARSVTTTLSGKNPQEDGL